MDIFDDELADADAGDRQKHARGIQQFTAEDDAENDRYRVQVQGFTDECRINEIVIDLREDEVEQHGLYSCPGVLGGREQGSKG